MPALFIRISIVPKSPITSSESLFMLFRSDKSQGYIKWSLPKSALSDFNLSIFVADKAIFAPEIESFFAISFPILPVDPVNRTVLPFNILILYPLNLN